MHYVTLDLLPLTPHCVMKYGLIHFAGFVRITLSFRMDTAIGLS